MVEQITRADKSELSEVADTLIRAFEDDPMIRSIGLPERVTRAVYTVPAILGFEYGRIETIGEGHQGVMVSIPGERSVFGLRQMIRAGALREALGLLRVLMNRTMRNVFSIIESDHRNLDIGPYIYLAMLGVAPEHQGRGLGGVLLRRLCARADEEQKAIYLETQTADNEKPYEHFGFETIKHVRIGEEIELWEMVRPSA